jgi:hypothetical protein
MIFTIGRFGLSIKLLPKQSAKLMFTLDTLKRMFLGMKRKRRVLTMDWTTCWWKSMSGNYFPMTISRRRRKVKEC